MWIGCYRYSFQDMMVLYVGSIKMLGFIFSFG
jgi:hypothetical protein